MEQQLRKKSHVSTFAILREQKLGHRNRLAANPVVLLFAFLKLCAKTARTLAKSTRHQNPSTWARSFPLANSACNQKTRHTSPVLNDCHWQTFRDGILPLQDWRRPARLNSRVSRIAKFSFVDLKR
jgi:hypothetical protein